jgi:hypothetical protein
MSILKRSGLLYILLGFFVSLQASTITLDGTYQGEGIYIQNPYNSADNSFCIQKVTINGETFEDHGSSAFEISLEDFDKGDYVNIKIEHKDECQPKILNGEALRSKSTYDMVSLEVMKNKVKWTTKNEKNEEPFFVERYQNNKWVVVGKVVGKGPGGYNNYSVDVTHFSGKNKYRVKQRSIGGVDRYSEVVEYKSDKEPVEFYPKRVSDELNFSRVARFEIYDSYGYLIKKGEAETVDVSDLEKGVYYLNIDNRTEKFLKK